MKYGFTLLTCLLALSSCGSGNDGAQGPQGEQGAPGATGVQGPTGPTASPSPSPSPAGLTVQELVDEQNAYRNSIGQESLVAGLACTLYTVPQTATTIIGATLTNVGSFGYTGDFNQTQAQDTVGLNVLPTALQAVYQTWYIVKCTGNLVEASSGYHEFNLQSDDGSNLYVDGLLINNDGLHSSAAKAATKYLQYGFHTFELDYFQGGGQEQLVLSENGSVMSSAAFFH